MKKKPFVPEWASNLESMIKAQRHRNPEFIFGDVPVMVLEEVFAGTSGASKRLKHRSSSATWSGVDALTADESSKFNKKMGFK
jgi:hypothetical protein